MPLLNGQPVEYVQAPASVDSTRTAGWEIRFTGERFDDYDKYMDRLQLYRKPVWTCKHSGRTCLTYEQALLEERAEAHLSTGIGFSDMLVCAMLTFLSQSTLPISQAVDALYYRFQHDFFMGEHIDVRYPDTEGAMYECTVVGIGPLPQKPALGVFAGDDLAVTIEDTAISPTTTSANAAIERLGDGAEQVIAFEQRKNRMYTVCLFDMDGSPIEGSDISVPATELSRSRNVFTKVALRQFLDDHMRRDPRPSSPWTVRPEWRERFHIPFMFSGEARLMRRPRPLRRESDMLAGIPPVSERRKSAASAVHVEVDPYAAERGMDVKAVRKFPADDLEYLQFMHVRYEQSIVWELRRKHDKATKTAEDLSKANSKSKQITDFFPISPAKRVPEPAEQDAEADKADEKDNEEPQNRWPVPLCAWQVPQALVSRTLAVYMFVSCFGTPLKLHPYSLDYFESALVYDRNSAPELDEEAAPVVSSVYRESALALLNSIIEDRRQGPTPANVTARIELMKATQDAQISDAEEPRIEVIDVDEVPAKANGAGAPKQENDMDIDEAGSGETTPRKPAKDELPPAGPLSEDRPNKRRASSRNADQIPINGSQAAANPRRSGRSRLQRASLLAGSSSIASSDSESGNESAESSATIGSAQKPRAKARARKQPAGRGRRRPQRGRSARGSAASSRVATPATTDNEDEAEPNGVEAEPPAPGVESMRGHSLLRHLSRAWAQLGADGAPDTWALKLAGWIVEAHYDYRELEPFYAALWSRPDLTAAGLEAALWGSASVEQRLVLLEMLVGECTNNESIRRYLDQCTESAAELRRERIELRRELKRTGEALADLDKEDEAQGGSGAALSREQGRREKEEETRRQKERRRLGEGERGCVRRLDYVERELRRNQIGRLTALGSDRFLNRYYFIDGMGGCPITGGTGRLFVQPAAHGERRETLHTQPRFVASAWALSMPPWWTGGLAPPGSDAALVELAFPNARDPAPELRELGARGELWGYYATAAQLDALKRWLDPKGRREAALLAELDLLSAAVGGSIRKRCQALETWHAQRLRAREQLCDRIGAQVEAAAADCEDPELAQMHRQLARIDSSAVPAALLPPAELVAELQQAPADSGAAQAPALLQANGVDQTPNNNHSSRASSVEPPSSVDQARRPNPASRVRGRPAKSRGRPAKTYMREFLRYENILS
ncbi:hypothetical protein H4S02_001914 [Coemansia sp. RSA 2611]|nr:hypothetical protein H4S02_001914 [Coemansia sp. RSA 2611]